MKFEGKYLYQENRFKDCSFLIENGKIHNLKVNPIPLDHEFNNPKDNSNFKLEKFQSEKALTPKGYNYFIGYLDKNNIEHRISIKLNKLQLFKLKWQLQEYLIQDKSLKLDAIKYITGVFLGIIGTFFFQHLKILPEIPPKQEIKKTIEKTKYQTDLKKDSITVE